MALDTTSLAALLEALRSWLIENPDGDIQEFADEHNVDVADLADGWHAYFAQADFSRSYHDLARTRPRPAQSAVQSAPVYTPSEPPPYGSSPGVYHEYLTQEVQQLPGVRPSTTSRTTSRTTRSTSRSSTARSSRRSTSTTAMSPRATAASTSTSRLIGSPINTGDVDDGGVLQQGDGNQANTGDVSASDGSAASVFGEATTIGSGNGNFGDEQNVTTTTLGDGNETAVITQDNDTDIRRDIETGDGGDADGGDGGSGRSPAVTAATVATAGTAGSRPSPRAMTAVRAAPVARAGPAVTAASAGDTGVDQSDLVDNNVSVDFGG